MTFEGSFQEREQHAKKIFDAIEHHMNHTDPDGRTNWGPWFVDEEAQVIAYLHSQGGVLNRMYYEIPLDRISGVRGRDNDSIEDWAFQLDGKTWVQSNSETFQLVEALCYLYKAKLGRKQAKG